MFFVNLMLVLSYRIKLLLNVILLSLLVSLIFFIVYQMLSRSVPSLPTFYWTEELSRFAFQWMVLLGSGAAVLHSDHFVLEAFRKGTMLDSFSKYFRDLSCMGLGLIFVVYGKEFAAFGAMRTATASGLSMVFVYSTFLVSGALMIFFGLIRAIVAMKYSIPEMENMLSTDETIKAQISDQDDEYR